MAAVGLVSISFYISKPSAINSNDLLNHWS